MRKKTDAIDLLNPLLPEECASPGAVVRQRRSSLQMSQIELADITGLQQENISAYETGRLTIGKEVAETFAAALGLSPLTILYPRGTFKKEKKHLEIEKRARRFLTEKLA